MQWLSIVRAAARLTIEKRDILPLSLSPQDKAFIFLSRQVTMVFSFFFLRSANQAPPNVSGMGWWRWWMDAKLCVALYFLTTMAWYSGCTHHNVSVA